jgi:hypothetical protein
MRPHPQKQLVHFLTGSPNAVASAAGRLINSLFY